jgi:hypothetical protein
VSVSSLCCSLLCYLVFFPWVFFPMSVCFFWGPMGEPIDDWKGGLLGYPPTCSSLTLWPPVGTFSGSIKAGRRSSYLLAITTERSKSCDDGLNTFRDEGRVLR